MAVYLTGRRLLPLILAVEFGSLNFLILIALALETLIWYVNCELAVFLGGSRWGVEFGIGMIRFGSMVYA